MKKTKTVGSILLTILLIFSVAIPAFAETSTEKGSITVQKPIAGQSYYVYRLFDLESYNKDKGTYSYTVNENWKEFVEQESIRDLYVSLETVGNKTYVQWVKDADVVAFAKLAMEWAKDNHVDIVDGITTVSTDDIVFKDLPLGYYLIDSSVGGLCVLTTNDPDVTVTEKNDLTTIEKRVKDNSTNVYAKENSVQIGDTVSFKSVVTLGKGAENVVVHDAMNHYLQLKPESVKVFLDGTEVESENQYTLTYEYTDPEHVYHGLQDNCTFEIAFTNAYIHQFSAGTQFTIEYDAVLGVDAKMWTSFDNKTWVSFGDDLKSTESTTTTRTHTFDLLKTDEKGKVIGTAKFYLYDAAEGGNIIKLIALSEDENWCSEYRVATKDDVVEGNGAEIKAGYAHVYGLDAKTYYLEETQQPEGYNKLSQRAKVDLSGVSAKLDENGNITVDKSGDLYGQNGVIGSDVSNLGGLQVINRSGTLLPNTGAKGSTILYAVGGIFVLVAGLLMITKKRMAHANLNK